MHAVPRWLRHGFPWPRRRDWPPWVGAPSPPARGRSRTMCARCASPGSPSRRTCSGSLRSPVVHPPSFPPSRRHAPHTMPALVACHARGSGVRQPSQRAGGHVAVGRVVGSCAAPSCCGSGPGPSPPDFFFSVPPGRGGAPARIAADACTITFSVERGVAGTQARSLLNSTQCWPAQRRDLCPVCHPC